MTDSGLMLAAEVGGLYGINVETLAGDKTLTPGVDKIYQYLDPDGANRTITLATTGAQAGDRFVIRHNGAFNTTWRLKVYQAAFLLDSIYAGTIKGFVFDGTNWIPFTTGTGEVDNKKYNVAIGFEAKAYFEGVSVGLGAQSYQMGVAIGYNAKGYVDGVGVGFDSDGHSSGVAVGKSASTDAKKYSIALGVYSKCFRDGETTINIDASSTQKNNAVQGRWAGTTTDNTPAEIYCAGNPTGRFTIRPSSALAFRMIIVARDNVANEVARYSVHDGLIKRDGANNTVMANCTVTVDHEDDAGWDCAVTADDVNEALIITVTGDDINPTQWVAVMDGVETHF